MHAPNEGPPAMSSDGKGAYPKAMVETWGKYQSMVDEEHHQHSLNQGKTGNAFKLLKNGREKIRECTH